MVTMDDQKESFIVTEEPTQDSLREERKRTGRYLAIIIAIFILIFCLHQVLMRKTPEYAAFFLAALIMFLYVLWVLYASKFRRKTVSEGVENNVVVEEVKTESESSSPGIVTTPSTKPSSISPTSEYSFCRSYSVA